MRTNDDPYDMSGMEVRLPKVKWPTVPSTPDPIRLAEMRYETPELAGEGARAFDFITRSLGRWGVERPERLRQWMESQQSPLFSVETQGRLPGLAGYMVPVEGGGARVRIHRNPQRYLPHELTHAFQNSLGQLRWDPRGYRLTPLGVDNRNIYESSKTNYAGEVLPHMFSDPGLASIVDFMEFRRSLNELMNLIPSK